MTAEQELAQLEAERAAELKHLDVLYHRTRREVRRALSPKRFTRRHLGALLGIAALAGMVIAPAPGAKATRRARKRNSGDAGRIGRILRGVIPARIREHIPGMSRADQAPAERDGTCCEESCGDGSCATERPARGVGQTVLTELLPMIAGRIKWTQLIKQAMGAYQQAMHGNHRDGAAGGADSGAEEAVGYRYGEGEEGAEKGPHIRAGDAGAMPG